MIELAKKQLSPRDLRMKHEDMNVYPHLYQRYRMGASIADLAGHPTKIGERQLRRRFDRLERFIQQFTGKSPYDFRPVETARIAAAAAKEYWTGEVEGADFVEEEENG